MPGIQTWHSGVFFALNKYKTGELMKRVIAVICLGLITAGSSWAAVPVSQPDTRGMNIKQLQALIPAEAQSRPGRTYVKARMIAIPGYDAMRKYYPTVAKAARQQGVVLLECQFDQMGNLLNCDSLAEVPQAFGFGTATIDLVQKYFTLDMRGLDAEPNADWIKIMVRWPD